MTTLVVMAAGLGTRYGGLKPLAAVGPSGETLLDYALYDAARAGFERAVLIVRRETEELFRRHVAEITGEAVATSYVIQEEPLGTAHAVLSCAGVVSEPFAVCNADDFYGAEAYRLVHRQLAAAEGSYALVAYPLGETLSPFGGVSRAVVETSPNGELERVVEVREVARRSDGIGGLFPDGATHKLEASQLISMNLWGFTTDLFPSLARQFALFRGGAEFLLGSAVNHDVAAGRARVRVLPTKSQWFGITFADDRARATEAIARLVRAGEYPARLREGFERV
jgi:NDP-sugar pyrophosphorylase family protein